MKTELTSRERVLATLEHKPADHLPLTFEGLCHGWVRFLNGLYPDPFERAAYYSSLGVDTGVNIQVNWRGTNHKVEVKEWTEKQGNEDWLIKEYNTAKGKLRQVVRKNQEYPHESIPLFDDYNVPPGRSVKYLVEKEEELDRLECILTSPDEKAVGELYEYAKEARKFCTRNGIMLTGYLQGVGDPLMWLSGVENILISAIDEPEFLQRYIEILFRADQAHLEVLLNAGIDMVIRRGWYESTDFWSPKMYRDFIHNPLKKEIAIAHQAGVKFAYIMNSGATALAGQFEEMGLDMLANIEPEKNDMARIKKEIGGKVALCGGVNNYNVIEIGTEAEVEKAVKEAAGLYSQDGGFMLAPSDSILDTSKTAQENFYKMITTWKEIA